MFDVVKAVMDHRDALFSDIKVSHDEGEEVLDAGDGDEANVTDGKCAIGARTSVKSDLSNQKSSELECKYGVVDENVLKRMSSRCTDVKAVIAKRTHA